MAKYFEKDIRVNTKTNTIDITVSASEAIARDLNGFTAKKVRELKEMFGMPVRIVKDEKKPSAKILKMSDEEIRVYVLKNAGTDSEEYKEFKVLFDEGRNHGEICRWFNATYPDFDKKDRSAGDVILKKAKEAIEERREFERQKEEDEKRANIIKLEDYYRKGKADSQATANTDEQTA